jgi:hypothetical protein
MVRVKDQKNLLVGANKLFFVLEELRWVHGPAARLVPSLDLTLDFPFENFLFSRPKPRKPNAISTADKAYISSMLAVHGEPYISLQTCACR